MNSCFQIDSYKKRTHRTGDGAPFHRNIRNLQTQICSGFVMTFLCEFFLLKYVFRRNKYAKRQHFRIKESKLFQTALTLEAVLFRALDTTRKIVMHKNRYFLCCKLHHFDDMIVVNYKFASVTVPWNINLLRLLSFTLHIHKYSML